MTETAARVICATCLHWQIRRFPCRCGFSRSGKEFAPFEQGWHEEPTLPLCTRAAAH